MIPKKIHYIWLSGEKIPRAIKKMMLSWEKYLPEHEIKHWDLSSLDISSVPFVRDAVKAKKWAFASDYIRLYALYTEGGIYLDSDIQIKKPLDDLLKSHDFVSAVEYHPSIVEQTDLRDYLREDFHSRDSVDAIPGIGLQAAFMASIPHHPFVKDCMSWYEKNDFFSDLTKSDRLIAPGIYAKKAEKYGFIYKNTTQFLEKNMCIFSSDQVGSSPETDTESLFAVHYCAGSWRKKSVFSKIKGKIKRLLMDKNAGLNNNRKL
jgi:hypothetical protein